MDEAPTADQDVRPAAPTNDYAGATPAQGSAQGRAEQAIERSFDQETGQSGDNGKARTGTSDVTYNLMSIVHHALEGADTYATYAQDAERSGDNELARFFRDVQEENRRRAERAKELLGERLNR